ncbi:hypothetical protein [Microbacterium cremeum]|nr:hypothetical protein [Microbacterium cremeum]
MLDTPASAAPVPPLSVDERVVISRVVDSAPPLRPALVAELAAIFGGAS